MSIESNKAFVQEYFDAIKKDKTPATLEKYMTDEDLKHHIAMYEVPLPGYWLEAQDMVAEGDKVTVRGIVHGVHKGDLMGIAPTGKDVNFPFFIIYRIANGKIVQHWLLADVMTLMQQVGAMPSPANG